MANTLTEYQDKLLARGLRKLRGRSMLIRGANRNYEDIAREKGDTVNIPKPITLGTSAVTGSATPPTPTNVVPEKVAIQLNQWRRADPVVITDKELAEIDANEHFIPATVEAQFEALARYINQDLASLYKGIYGFAGSAAAVPFASNVTGATDSRKVLNQQLCPRPDRWGVLDHDAEANALALAQFSDADKVASSREKMEGEIGRKYGINWMSDDDIPTHTTAGAGTPLVDDGSAAIGDKTIHTDGWTTKPEEGDLFTFAGHSQQYVVVSSTALAGTDSDITFEPALVAAPADNEAITVVASHKVNLIFQREAFSLAMRPLQDSTILANQLGNTVRWMGDPVTGLLFRMEVSRQNKQFLWDLDALWGRELVRPECAVRLIGSP